MKYRKTHDVKRTEPIYLSKEEVHSISDFILFFRAGIYQLSSYEFENALSSGIFLSYNPTTETFEYNNFCKMLYQMGCEIYRLKIFEKDFSYQTQDKLLNSIKHYHKISKEIFEFDFFDLGLLNAIYERLVNIQNITMYLIDYMRNHDDKIKPPIILNGIVESEQPTESDILSIFES